MNKHKVSGALRDARGDLNDLRPTIIVFPPQAVYRDTSGMRRRDRRPAQIAELKANRKSRLAPTNQEQEQTA